MAVVKETTTSQRVRVALVIVLAPSNAARGILPGSPLAPPNANSNISADVRKRTVNACRRWYTFRASDAVSSGALASIAGFRSTDKHSDRLLQNLGRQAECVSDRNQIGLPETCAKKSSRSESQLRGGSPVCTALQGVSYAQRSSGACLLRRPIKRTEES